MRQKEQLVYDALKRHAPKGAWLQRIENVAGVGQPDVLAAAFSGPIFIELKAPKAKRNADVPVLGKDQGLNKDQENWHMRATIHGFRTWIVARDTQGRLFVAPGLWAEGLNMMTRDNFIERGAVSQSDWAWAWQIMQDTR